MLYPNDPGVPSPPDLSSANAMDAESRNLLFTSIQRELHAIARRNMAHQSRAHTLQPTALVNEAYLRLHTHPDVLGMPPGDFLRLAAKVMQNLLVNHAREKKAKKRTAPGERVPLDSVMESFSERALDILALNEALEKLHETDPVAAALVQLRFFAGQQLADCGRILGIPERTINRRWKTTRAKLRFMIEQGDAEPRGTSDK